MVKKSQKPSSSLVGSQVSFVAAMSHEIRTPLAVIRGFTDLISEEGQTNPKWVEAISKACGHIASLVDDVLDLAKFSSGKMEASLSMVDVRQVLEEVCGPLRALAERKGLSFSTEVASDVPRLIETDSTRFKQILFNIVGNAIKFTDSGKVSAEVTMLPGLPMMAIVVSDEGIGIRDADKRKLFKPFSQVDSAMSKRFGGTGLGLVLSRDLARLLGGDITYSKGKVKGSVFTVTMPTGNMSNSVDVRGGSVRLDGHRILVVDDAPDLAALMQYVLQKAGAEVETAMSGVEAIKKVSESQFDAIIMDIQMPVMDGMATAKALRESGHLMPIIGVTAFGHSYAEKFAGFSERFSKPVNMSVLTRTIASLVNKITLDQSL